MPYNWPDSDTWEGRISRTPEADETLDISIIIPAYNEARRLPATIRRLHGYLANQDYTWEIIVVANGCTDGTEAVVREAATSIPTLRLLSLQNRGKGLASREGALASRGAVLFLCDADLSMPPDNLERFFRVIDSFDLAVGSREAAGSHRYDEPWHRHLMGRVFNWLVQVLAVKGISDTQCGFKALRREPGRTLFEIQTLNGFGFDVELLFLARKFGFSMREVPIEWYFDADTRVRPGVDSLGMLAELVMVRIRNFLGRYGSPASSPVGGRDSV